MKLKLKNVRLAFPALFVPRKSKDKEDASYEAKLLISPSDPQVGEIEAAILQAAKDKWGDAKGAAEYVRLKAADRTCLHNGDAKSDTEGFAGMLFVSSRNRARPLVLDQNRQPLTQQDGRPYSGCYVNVVLDVWAQDNAEFGKRINATVTGVQFARDGEAFAGGTVATEDDFDTVGGDGGAGADDLI